MLVTFPVFALLSGCGGPSKPTPQQMNRAVGDFLVNNNGSSCDGNVSLNNVEVKRIGGYEKQLGGFPVYADYSVTCEGRVGATNIPLTTTSVASDGATTQAAVCYARAAADGHECFMPEVLKNATRQMTQQVEEMMRKLPK